jgi:rhodanese-related sulfurtransferase
MLYDSLHEKLLPLPDETIIYPAHGAGSLCGKNISKDTSSTMGIQRRFNYALQPMSKADFVKLVIADQPDAPEYFTYDAILNTKERQTLDRALEHSLKALALEQALELDTAGAQLLDVREAGEFEAAHLKGSINIGLGGSFATWAGTILRPDTPIVIIAEPGREQEAAMRLGRIGFDHVAGYLDDAMMALNTRPDLVEATERVTALNLAQQISSSSPPLIIDVRTEHEWKEKHLDGSLNIPLNRFPDRMSEVPGNRTLVVHCAGGYRSAIAASFLKQHKYANVQDLVGGIGGWEAEKLPVVRG